MGVQAALESDAQLAKPGEPRMRTFDHPAMLAKALAAFDSTASNATGDASRPEKGTTAPVVLALIGVQLAWALARPAWQTTNGRDGIDALLEQH
jgi:hypothetical protein